MPKVSVLIPLYNTDKTHLKEVIESVLNQTFSDFELILLNDGSTVDYIKATVESYNDKRIKYFEQENLGIAKSRNKLMDLAQGEYLALIDHDDIMKQNRLEKQVQILDKNLNIGLVGSYLNIFGNINSVSKVIQNPKPVDFLKNCSVLQPSAMLRKSFFDKYNLRYKEGYTYAEDYELWARASFYMEIYNIQEPLTDYRWHKNNMSVVNKNIQEKNTAEIKREMIERLADNEHDRTLLEDMFLNKKPDKFLKRLFSIRNSYNKSEKIVTIFNKQFKVKKHN